MIEILADDELLLRLMCLLVVVAFCTVAIIKAIRGFS